MVGTVGEGALIELDLPARPEVVAVARLVVGSLALDDPAFDDDRAADLRLAVSEACTNAVRAQQRRGETAPIQMLYRVRSGWIEVRVRDAGGGFDPESLRKPVDLSRPGRLDHEGGLGVPLIRLLSDTVEFRPIADGTEVVMGFGPLARTGRLTD